MSLLGEQVLLRVYLRGADRTPLAPTSGLLVKASRSAGLGGATVLQGIMGFGPYGVAESGVRSFSIVEHLPVIVEIVDAPLRIAQFVDGPLSAILSRAMITLERATVMMYRDRHHDAPASSMRLGALLQTPLSTVPRIQVRDNMQITENGIMLRIFAGESDRADGRPLYESIVAQARQLGLAGATVLRGVESFGANSVVHKAALVEMSSDLPIVIEIVDAQPMIEKLLPYLEQNVKEGMITMEHVQIVIYGKQRSKAAPVSPAA